MTVDLGQMRSVVVLADHLHFGRAAAALYVSQPALTKQIRKVEEALGGPLFVRKPRQLTLTRSGEVFVERARCLLRDSQLALDLSRSAMRGEAGLLRIGFGLPSLATGLPDLIQRFRSRFRGIQIMMREMSTPAQVEAIANRTLDVGFVRLPISAAEVSTTGLFSDRLILAVGPNSGKSLRAGLKSFASESFVLIARSASSTLHEHVLRTCQAAGFEPRIVQEANELFTVLSFVRAGVGVALVPNSCKFMNVPRVRYLETGVPGAAWKIGAASHNSSASDLTVRNFLSVVRQEFRVRR
jgi:DNA-binding transcriptional LysR family regulator